MTVEEWLHRPKKVKPAPKLRQCEHCLQLHDGGPSRNARFCSEKSCIDEREQAKAEFKLKRQTQMKFRKSFEEGDYKTFFEELRLRVEVDDNDCWNWAKRLKNGYPIVKWGKSQAQVHRLSLEAKHGKPLGTQAAHHICANPACVNPDHLQPVTHRDNVAEMLQRRCYLDRIAELEAAVQQIDPSHPVLHRIEVA